MSYGQYRVKIGETVIKNSMIAPDTYNFQRNERIVASWKDANLIEHHDVAEDFKVEISLSIRERNMEDQAEIAPIFESLENIYAEYWDDIACEYKTGLFYMATAPVFNTRKNGASLLYMPTAITLKEY